MSLEGKVAVVTGSARNIGRACVIALAQQGAKVVVNARSRERVDAVVKEIEAFGGSALPSYHSVATKEGAEGIIRDAVEGFGTIDILVNNAGIQTYGMIHEMPDEDWQEVLNVNLTGYFRTTKAALPYMMEKNWGRVINMSSHAGLTGTTLRSNYAAAKGGIIAFTKAIAKEYGKYHITANAIAPFVVQAEEEPPPGGFLPGAMYAPQPEEFKAQNTAVSTAGMAIPGRAGPEEVAPMVAFFASDEAWYITGQVISVGGGRWM